MPPKTREYYLATSPGRDLAWFFFGTLAAAQYRKTKAEPTPTYSVPKSRRIEVPSVEEVERKALMSPADVKAMAGAAKAKSAAARSKKSKSRTAPLRNAGPWSDWYVSEDRSYFWRARQTPNKTWDYQYTPGYRQNQPRSSSSTTSSSKPKQQSPAPSPGPATASPLRARDAASPKSSWPTIVTTSTGQPTELSISSTKSLTTLAKELDDGSKQATSSALVPLVVAAKPPAARSTHNKRPAGPVMRLLQEGRSRRAESEVIRSVPAAAGGRAQGHTRRQGQGDGAGSNGNHSGSVVMTKARAAYARKLHNKVKSEKELKVDPKRRVRAWLKGVEVDGTPIALDEAGFPIYR